MSTPLARTLRLFAILALLGGVFSHEMAVAGGEGEAAKAVTSQHHHFSDAALMRTCNGAFGDQSSSCCLLGHCLVGVVSQQGNEWMIAPHLELNAATFALLSSGITIAPYRPPEAL